MNLVLRILLLLGVILLDHSLREIPAFAITCDTSSHPDHSSLAVDGRNNLLLYNDTGKSLAITIEGYLESGAYSRHSIELDDCETYHETRNYKTGFEVFAYYIGSGVGYGLPIDFDSISQQKVTIGFIKGQVIFTPEVWK